MQTFLPYPSFPKSTSVLDNKRLGKQRVEAKQIIRALQGKTFGWRNHPATRMWDGSVQALCLYGLECCLEWKRRGFQDSLEPWFLKIGSGFGPVSFEPWWLGHPKFHSAHRAALLAKNFEWYSQFGWLEEPKMEYWWPTQHEEEKENYHVRDN